MAGGAAQLPVKRQGCLLQNNAAVQCPEGAIVPVADTTARAAML